jgi:FkbM family methyltransferase
MIGFPKCFAAKFLKESIRSISPLHSVGGVLPVTIPLTNSILGQIIRWPFRALPSEMVVRIPFSPRRGMRWIVGSSNHSTWLGLYEPDQTRNLCRHLRRGGVFFDIGTQAGYHTLLASRLVGAKGRVCSWEPVPRNVGYLRRHVTLNGLANVTVIEAAVSDRDGTVHFDTSGSYMAGHISEQGALAVPTMRLDTLLAESKIPIPTVMKIDVEGAEFGVLQGAQQLLLRARPVILLDAHDFLGGEYRGLHDRCCRYLQGLGYRCESIPSQFATSVIATPD